MINSPNLFEKALIDNIIQGVGTSISVTLTDNRRSMVSIKKSKGGIAVRLSRSFAMAGKAVLRDLVLYIRGEAINAPKSVLEFAHSQTIPKHLVKKALSGLNPVGEIYDLAKISMGINERYFQKMLKVNITWGNLVRPKPKARNKIIQLGSYDKNLELIRIHPVLDNDFVPPEYIDLVVYHEMLHQHVEAVAKKKGKRNGHTKEFLQLEKEHEHYNWCVAWEKQNMNHLIKLRNALK